LLPPIAITVGVVAAAGAVAVPAMAATVVNAKVVSSTKVEFKATAGKTDNLTVTLSGRTVTFDNKVTVKAGKGCKAVKNDVTKVTCTTSAATEWVTVSLGDKNDAVRNQTGLGMSVWGGTGTDTITGGPKNDYLHGGANYDRIWGSGGNDRIWGDAGGDSLDGGVGDDSIDGAAGNDVILGRDGDDEILDGAGNDRVYGGGGSDFLFQSNLTTGTDKDLLSGGAGDEDAASYYIRETAVTADADGATGDDGKKGEGDSIGSDVEGLQGGNAGDRLVGSARSDILVGSPGNDTLIAGASDDVVVGEEGSDSLDGGTNTEVGDYCDEDFADSIVDCEFYLSGAPTTESARAGLSASRQAAVSTLSRKAEALSAGLGR
jgi:Ca2+-binding RTX toxin-like protein